MRANGFARLLAEALLVCASANSIACGGGSSSTASFSGTVRGQTFQPKDAISTNATIQTPTGPASVGAIVLTNQSGVCADAAANNEPKNSMYFLIFLGVLNPSAGTISAPTAAGDFSVYARSGLPPANLAVIVSSTTDAACHDIANYDATGISGTVHLTSLSNGNYTGTFDVNVQQVDSNGTPVGTPDRVTGSFNASNCAGLSALISTTRTTTCI
jgi:hypothetical protein